MVDYKNGKIYKIVNDVNDKIYVGSTAQKLLCQRFNKHKHNAKNEKYYKLEIYKAMCEIGIEHFKIELIEDYACDRKELLNAREGYWIKLYDSVKNGYNKVIAGRTQKQYKEDNKDYVNDLNKRWIENNKERVREIKRKYKEKNKDNPIQYKKDKEKISQYEKERYLKMKNKLQSKVQCIHCGNKLQLVNILEHVKTQHPEVLNETNKKRECHIITQ